MKKNKILLVYPPVDYLGMGGRLNPVIDIYQPLGLAYIAAALENAGYDVKIIDAKAERFSIDSILEHVSGFNPGIVGLGSSTPDFCITRLLAEKIKSLGDYTVVIGGPHVSALPEETMETGCFDYGVLGEGERTIVELADAISARRKDKIPDIKGIIFNNGKKPVRTTKRPYIEDLDTIPLPARRLLPDIRRYSYSWYRYLPTATIITTRGCPYKCVFCDQAVFGNHLRRRSVPNIVDEIEMLVKRHGVKGIDIVDDLFTVDRERILKFCRELISRKMNVVWSCLSRTDHVTPETLKAMKSAGCWQIIYGIESGSQDTLDRINKNINLSGIKETIFQTRTAGIEAAAFLMIGLPGDNEQNIRDSLSFVKRLGLDKLGFRITQPFPGSELYKNAVARKEIFKDIEYRYYHNMAAHNRFAYVAKDLTAETLVRYRNKFYREFYMRPLYLLKQIIRYRGFKVLFLRMSNILRAMFC